MYYLSRLFKKVSGYTFKEYLILQRIANAKSLLVYTDYNVTQICMKSGFNNVNHFIRTFKKQEGITPYQYRKKFT
jgi:AraC-like DNA-binding protein